MVCAKCEKKLAKSSSLACTDVWRPTGAGGDRNARKVGENKLLSSKARYSPYAPSKEASTSKGKGSIGIASGSGGTGATLGKCEVCRSTVSRAGAKFCQGCAYKKGVCAMCSKAILDTSQYKMSSK